MFVIVVAFLFVLIMGAISFTDVVENGTGSLNAAVEQALRPTRTSDHH